MDLVNDGSVELLRKRKRAEQKIKPTQYHFFMMKLFSSGGGGGGKKGKEKGAGYKKGHIFVDHNLNSKPLSGVAVR